MWQVFKTFVDQYRNRNPIPFRVLVRRQEVFHVPLSKKETTFVHFSFAVFVLHIIYCFLRLLWLWKNGFPFENEEQDSEIIRIYALLVLTFLSLTFASKYGVHIRASSSIAVPPDYRILIRAMKVVIWLTNYPLHMILIAGVVISADPLYPPIRSIICILSLSSIVFKLAAFLIRASLLTICLIVLFKAVNAFFIIGLMVVCSASEVLQVLNDLNPKRVVFSERNFQARIYGTIRMRDHMNFLIYLFVPPSSLIALLFVVFLIPEAAKVYQRSYLYLYKAGKDLRRGSWEKKVVKSLRPVGIQIGPFGQVKRCPLTSRTDVIKSSELYTQLIFRIKFCAETAPTFELFFFHLFLNFRKVSGVSESLEYLDLVSAQNFSIGRS
ncbi:hypothetical protein Fcan01_10460 [Folsomia candida]|uniref:Uncharacterized protein n=1 Tax=Folsomia candida TaxID=158441 RepID=A0A226EC38_FOLCA|nr:hypothetical protein Fcan01_10460 [Folsomia candida]